MGGVRDNRVGSYSAQSGTRASREAAQPLQGGPGGILKSGMQNYAI